MLTARRNLKRSRMEVHFQLAPVEVALIAAAIVLAVAVARAFAHPTKRG